VLEKLHVMEKLDALETQTWTQMSKFFDALPHSKESKKAVQMNKNKEFGREKTFTRFAILYRICS